MTDKHGLIVMALFMEMLAILPISDAYKSVRQAESRARCVEAMRDRPAVEIVAACGEVRK